MRLSTSDGAEGPEKDPDGKWLKWGIEQSIFLIGELKELGVDLIDVSSRETGQLRRFLSGRGTRYGDTQTGDTITL